MLAAPRNFALSPLVALTLLIGCAQSSPSGAGSDKGVPEEPSEDLGTTSEALSTDDVMTCAQHWVDLSVPYCGGANGGTDYICGGTCHRPSAPWDNYRSDCSGFVSWCWQIASDPTTSSYMNDKTGSSGWHTITIAELQPGDALVCDGHIKLFSSSVSSTKMEIYQESDCGEVANKRVETFTKSGNTLKFQYDDRTYHPIRRNGIEPPIHVAGYVDSAGARVKGWSADLNSSSSALNVDLYFGGDSGAGFAVSTKANIARPDVAMSLGISPDHGFDVATPLYYCDGKSHKVYGYGHAVKDGTAVELKSSPQDLTCPPPTAPDGLLRHVTSPAVLTAWGFDEHSELQWMTPADATTHTISSDWPDAMKLGKSADGAVWVVDDGTRRHVVNPASFKAWGFDSKDVATWDDTEMAQYVQGLDLPAVPTLVQTVGAPAVYVLDADANHLGDAPNGPQGTGGAAGTGSGGSSDGEGGGASGSADDPSAKSGGCSVSTSTNSKDAPVGVLALGALGVLAIRRRPRAVC